MELDERTALIAAAFLLAGAVKGVVGQGFPSVALAFLSLIVGVKSAIALMLLPTFVTNVWQGLVGGALLAIVKRLWPLLLCVVAGSWVGVTMTAALLPRQTALLTGGMLCAYGSIGLVRPVFPSPGRHEVWLGPIVGLLNGVLGGMTGSFAVPGVPFMQALGFNKDMLVQGMGVLFSIASLSVAIALSDQRLISPQLLAISIGGAVPGVIGMWLGQLVRKRLSEAAFRRVMFMSLIALGAFIVWRAV